MRNIASTNKTGLLSRMKVLIFGSSRDVGDPNIFHKLSLVAFFAWVGLGSDGLSSSCYGPEEAFLALGRHTHLGIFVAAASVFTILIISTSYSQIIELFPSGGGGYLVASKLLAPWAGMASGCALIIDYVLTITISVASGADALFSFLPGNWLQFKLAFSILIIVLLILVNLRGVKESVIPLVPIFLIFIATHVFVIIYSVASHPSSFGLIIRDTGREVHATYNEIGLIALILLILKAYSMGAGTFTGIEAVSNGIPILREPRVKTARRTMLYMALSLSVMVMGLMIAYLLYNVSHVPGKTLNAVLFESITREWHMDFSYSFVFITLISEMAILFVAAQTGFLDGPRVLANMAIDSWVPRRFASLNDRLVTQNGILIMGVSSIVLMILSQGSVRFLVVLYSINVFITFSLSQMGMVRHWWMQRKVEAFWKKKLFINGIGFILTIFILISVTVIKFDEGGWITLLITGAVVLLVLFIKNNYRKTAVLLRRLDRLIDLKDADDAGWNKDFSGGKDKTAQCKKNAKTAVLFVNGFNGLGMHTLLNIHKNFGGIFKNFVFLSIGVINSGVFKGAGEIEGLRRHVREDVERYVEFMNRRGFYAEGISDIGVDVVDEAVRLAPSIMDKYPGTVFFAGQLVFPEETYISRLLHNYTAFSIQRKFYHMDIPIVILPVRI